MQENKEKFYILENILRTKDLFILYKGLIESSVWNLNRSSGGSNGFGTFPGFIVQDGENIFNPYFSGYFVSLLKKLNFDFEKYNFSLPNKIRRIHLGAKNNTSYTDFHCDTTEPNTFSIVGFLTPVWAQNWGGELMIEEQKINFTPGKFVIFKSNLRHNGIGQSKEIPYWRISINYILGE